MTPDDFTNQELILDVGDGHKLYIQDWGNNIASTPIVYLHGGPGNGCDNRDKRFFDPKSHRVIFFDQRGSGKSTPYGSLNHNTTDNLVSDITKIVDKLAINKFVLVGSSWGSTLALIYAIKNPKRVKAMVISGIYTASKAENDWLENGGWRHFYPELWEKYLSNVPNDYKNNPADYFYNKILGKNSKDAKRAAFIYNSMELGILKLDEIYRPEDFTNFDPTTTKLEIHYLANKCFIKNNFIIINASKLTMPIYIIQGRYDMVCPPSTAYLLYKSLPKGKISWSINGHLRQHESVNIQRLYIENAVGGS